MIKISTLYVYIKKVYHYNKWSLKINLFTKVFIKRSVLIFGRTQPFFLRFVTNLGEAALKGMLYLGFVFYVTFWFTI